MDPKACLARLLSALADRDAVESVLASADLLVWMLASEAEIASAIQRDQISRGMAQLADRIEDTLGGI